jgi:CRISPR/Cas system CSM-associated protein Csm2 small subunit
MVHNYKNNKNLTRRNRKPISYKVKKNKIKTYIKKKRNVNNFEELAKNVDTSIEKVKPESYKNYFEYAYGTTKNRIYKKTINTKT